MKTLLVGTLMVGALALSSMAQCEQSCSVNPQFLDLESVWQFLICNNSVGNCPDPITGMIWENHSWLVVTPLNYSLLQDECQLVTVYVDYPAAPPEGDNVVYTDCGNVAVRVPDLVNANDSLIAFALAEACPNPFNPSTTISYSVPETQEATLSVFNTNGQLVQTLVSDTVERGEHKVFFDASSLSSGVYVYTLQTANQTATKKMVLVR